MIASLNTSLLSKCTCHFISPVCLSIATVWPDSLIPLRNIKLSSNTPTICGTYSVGYGFCICHSRFPFSMFILDILLFKKIACSSTIKLPGSISSSHNNFSFFSGVTSGYSLHDVSSPLQATAKPALIPTVPSRNCLREILCFKIYDRSTIFTFLGRLRLHYTPLRQKKGLKT